MRFLTAFLKNFKSVEVATFALDDQGVVLVEGENKDISSARSNGAGKSTIFTDALTWCLYGSTPSGLRADQILPEGKKGKGCEVTVEMMLGGKHVKVSRYRAHKEHGSALVLHVDGKDVSRSVVAATEAQLELLLGVDRETFLYTTVLGQGMSHRFTQLTDAERKRILEAVARVGVYAGARELARKELAQAKTEAAVAATKQQEAARAVAVAEQALVRAEAAKQAAEQEHERKRELLLGMIEQEGQKLAEAEATVIEQQAAAATWQGQLKGLNAQEAKLRERVDAARAKQIEIASELRALEREVQRAQSLGANEQCPTCEQPTAGSPLLASLAAQHQRVVELRAAAGAETSSASKLEANWQKFVAQVAAVRGKADVASSLLAQATRQVIQSQQSQDRVRQQLLGLDTRPNLPLDGVRDATQAVAKAKEAEREAALQAATTATAVAELEYWIEGFQAIRVKLLDRVLGYLNDRLKHYLGVLTDGEIGAELSHNDKGKIDLKVTTRGGSYESASGGEKDRVDVAVAFALHDLATTQSRFASNILVLDEIGTFLDDRGIEKLMQLVSEKVDRVESVFLISHNQLFKSYAEKVWTVVKEGGRSRLEAA